MEEDTQGSVTRLRELEIEWRERSNQACREFRTSSTTPMSGQCERCNHNGWAHAWRLAADELADAAALAPAVVPSQEQKDALQALVDEAQVLGIYTDDDAPPVVAPVAHEHVYRMDPTTQNAVCECGDTVTLAESLVAPVAVQHCPNCGGMTWRNGKLSDQCLCAVAPVAAPQSDLPQFVIDCMKAGKLGSCANCPSPSQCDAYKARIAPVACRSCGT